MRKQTDMLKAIIIDDESKARNILRILIERHIPILTELYSADGAEEGLRLIEEHDPNIVFLDIEMPFMDGFDLLEAVEKRNFDIIFTTAYDQYAIKAIRFSALDYLLKPIDIEELKAAVDRFLEKKNLKRENGKLYKNFITNLKNINDDVPRLAISTQEGVAFFEVKDIIRCEASSNYTTFYLTEGKKFVASKTLKEYEKILDEYRFFRVHKSHLVSLNFVTSFQGNQLELKDGSTVEVSRRKKQMVMNRLRTHQ